MTVRPRFIVSTPSLVSRAKRWVRTVMRDVVALWIAARDPRTPMAAKVVAGAVAAYALSPIDLIPDFIPVIGYLDDLLIVPLGIVLACRLIPDALMAQYRATAAERAALPSSRSGLVAVVAVWLVGAIGLAWLIFPRLFGR